MNNLIIMKGGVSNDVKKALRQWIELYVNKLPRDFSFKVSTNQAGTHLIQADERLGNDLFYFLVNYLYCLKGIKHNVSIRGFTTGQKNDILKGKNVLVYISPTDKEGDNVFVVTFENEIFKISFNGKITKIKDNVTFEPPMDLKFDNLEIIKCDKQKEERTKNRKIFVSVEKRFKIISIFFCILFVLTHFIFFALEDKEMFQKLVVVFGGGIWLWFFMDYKMLRYNNFYLRCLGIAIVYAIYTGFLGSYLKDNTIRLVTFHASVFLIMQKPLRKIYLALLRKEPQIDRFGTFEDLCYTIILFLGSTLLPMLIIHEN